MADQPGSLPVARLCHVPIGHTIRIIGDPKPHTILSKDAHYAHFGGDDKASLCCPVAEEYMEFGSDGWRIKLIHTIGG